MPGPQSIDDSEARAPTGGALLDWSSALDALYTFEDDSDLGRDSSGHGWHLSTLGDVKASEAQLRSKSAAHLAGQASLWSNDTFFRTFAGTSFTAGAWVRAAPTEGAPEVIANGDGFQGGFALRIVPTAAAFSCEVADGKGGSAVASRAQIADYEDWTHVVCRYDAATTLIQIFLNGVALVPSMEAPAGIGEGSGHFALGYGMDGDLDEAFFTYEALTNAQVARIWGCGVDGQQCSCSEADTTKYATCPFGDCAATSLPPCDSKLP